METVALWIGYTVMTLGGVAALAGLAWLVMELWWRQVRTVGLLQDIYAYRREKQAREMRARAASAGPA